MKPFLCIFSLLVFLSQPPLPAAVSDVRPDSAGACRTASPWLAGSILTPEELAAASADSSFTASPVPDDVFRRMRGKSYPEGCSVARSELSYLRMLHYDFGGRVRRGEMVCNRAIAPKLISIFRTLYEKKYPIHSIRLIDDFGADDERSMQANNTSCFCFRRVAGKKTLSKHSRGLAIDINPLQNPCVRKNSKGQTVVQPSNAREYINRSRSFQGKITTADLCYRLFREAGFTWGGGWRTLKDYQHFEK